MTKKEFEYELGEITDEINNLAQAIFDINNDFKRIAERVQKLNYDFDYLE